MSHHPCHRCDRAPATEDSLYCPACKVQFGIEERLSPKSAPAPRCPRCMARLPGVGHACAICAQVDQAIDQAKRRKPPRKALRDMQRPLDRNPA